MSDEKRSSFSTTIFIILFCFICLCMSGYPYLLNHLKSYFKDKQVKIEADIIKQHKKFRMVGQLLVDDMKERADKIFINATRQEQKLSPYRITQYYFKITGFNKFNTVHGRRPLGYTLLQCRHCFENIIFSKLIKGKAFPHKEKCTGLIKLSAEDVAQMSPLFIRLEEVVKKINRLTNLKRQAKNNQELMDRLKIKWHPYNPR